MHRSFSLAMPYALGPANKINEFNEAKYSLSRHNIAHLFLFACSGRCKVITFLLARRGYCFFLIYKIYIIYNFHDFIIVIVWPWWGYMLKWDLRVIVFCYCNQCKMNKYDLLIVSRRSEIYKYEIINRASIETYKH